MNTEPSAIETLSRAREQTLAAGSARVVLFIKRTWEMPPMPPMPPRRPLQPLKEVAKAAGKRGLKRVATKLDQ